MADGEWRMADGEWRMEAETDWPRFTFNVSRPGNLRLSAANETGYGFSIHDSRFTIYDLRFTAALVHSLLTHL